MPHLLELFSGTKSIGRVFEAAGWQVTSVDIEAKYNPTICKNVLDLSPEDIGSERGVDLIWGSPPCVHYSCARTNAKTPRDLEGSDKLVAKVLEFAAHYGCYYFMENPHSGLLKTRQVVEGIPMRVLDYCMYAEADHPHKGRKRTAIWTNTDWHPRRRLCNKDCEWSDGRRHFDIAQRGSTPSRGCPTHQLEDLYAIPSAIPRELLEWWGEGRSSQRRI